MKGTRKMLIGAALVAALATLASCGGGSSSPGTNSGSVPPAATSDPGSSGSLAVSGHEFMFDPATLTIAAGGTIEFTNNGTIEHNLTITDDPSLEATAAAGASASFTVDLEPGTYPFTCTIPGHEQAGMIGTLTVT